jgi:glycosyltransferase involved in cell wall biosynthesis
MNPQFDRDTTDGDARGQMHAGSRPPPAGAGARVWGQRPVPGPSGFSGGSPHRYATPAPLVALQPRLARAPGRIDRAGGDAVSGAVPRPRIVIVSTYPPRRCGLASYTADVRVALGDTAPDLDVVIAAVDRDGLRYGPEVVTAIDQDSAESYRRVAAELAVDTVAAVLIQHEFGIFGGRDGVHVLTLADELRARGIPYLVTLHTVLSRPDEHQRAILRQLCGGAARVTVFGETARNLLLRTTPLDGDKVVVIPHGAPLALLATDPQPLRAELAALDRTGPVVATFGFLGAGKGLDMAIEAIADIVAEHPDLRYVIAGQTHPEVVRRFGEAYRTQLDALVDRLALRNHVTFVDAFLTVQELGALLRRTTVFLTPYRSPEQTCSGALTFALATGRPVVSTAYQYARDMLATGAGLVVPCQDRAALAAALHTLLSDPAALAAARAAAWAVGSRLSWPQVAARMAGLVRDVAADQVQAPPLDLTHLRRLTGRPRRRSRQPGASANFRETLALDSLDFLHSSGCSANALDTASTKMTTHD